MRAPCFLMQVSLKGLSNYLIMYRHSIKTYILDYKILYMYSLKSLSNYVRVYRLFLLKPFKLPENIQVFHGIPFKAFQTACTHSLQRFPNYLRIYRYSLHSLSNYMRIYKNDLRIYRYSLKGISNHIPENIPALLQRAFK